jgi:hypothetical protein
LRRRDRLILDVAHGLSGLIDPTLGRLGLTTHGGLHFGATLHGVMTKWRWRSVAQSLRPDQRQSERCDGGEAQQRKVETIQHDPAIARSALTR